MNWVYDEKANQHRPHASIHRLRVPYGSKIWQYMSKRTTGVAATKAVRYYRNTRRVRKILRRIGAL